MEDLKEKVIAFGQGLEKCSAEQRCMVKEVMESFSTFVEEVLIALHIKLGTSDTINVQKLLFEDLIDLGRHFQPVQEETVRSYLKRLQEASKDRLNSLHKTVLIVRSDPQGTEKHVLERKLKEHEMKDLADFLSMMSSLTEGIKARNPKDSFLNAQIEKMKEHRGIFSYQDELLEVEEINKRNLGKMIVRFVGHEGIQEKSSLRRLLQACIDFLQTETEDFWKNASITIYDDDDNMYKIVSGTRKHQFICRMKDDEPFLNKKNSFSDHKKPKINHTHSFCSIV